jgi:ankyrin repeat protein
VSEPGAADLFAAIAAGDLDAVRAAVAADPASASARDDAGVSLVRSALYRGRRDIAEVLEAADADLDVFDLAALGRADLVAAAVDEDATLATAFSSDGFTALHFAAFLGGADAAVELLRRDADVDAISRNEMRVRPLHSAAAGVGETVLALLLEHGADPDAQQQGGYTALHEAALRGDLDMTRLLLAHGADPSIATDDGRTAADIARERGNEAVLRLLG